MNASNLQPLAYSVYTRQVLEYPITWGRYKGFNRNMARRFYAEKFYLVSLFLFQTQEVKYYFINDSLAIWDFNNTYYVSEEVMTSPFYKEIILDFIKLKKIDSYVTYVKSLSSIAKIMNFPMIDFCKYKLGKLGVTKKKKSNLQKVWDSL